MGRPNRFSARRKVEIPATQPGCASIGSGMADGLNSLTDNAETVKKT